LTEEVGPLLGTHRRFVAALDLVGVEGFLGTPGSGPDRPPEDRRALARAFPAKAVWDLPTTRHLIDRFGADPALRRLCGWSRLGDIPSEAKFSRTVAEFSASLPAERMHEALVVDVLGDALIGHVSRDSTAIGGREAAVAKPKVEVPKRRPGRPGRGEERPKALSRLERQANGMRLNQARHALRASLTSRFTVKCGRILQISLAGRVAPTARPNRYDCLAAFAKRRQGRLKHSQNLQEKSLSV